MENGASSYRRFLSGEDSGLGEIVGEYKDGLILFLNGFVGNIHVAEELAEDTFFRLMVKKPRFSGKSSFRSWLYGIGRHVALDHLRREGGSADVPLEDAEEYVSDGEDLERAFIGEERKKTVHDAMKKLRPEYRQILWLVYFEEMTNEEASVAMRKSPRQIRNLLYRAKQSLKSELEKEGFTYEEF